MFQYEMLPTTWFYLSAIIILAIFFKFNRFWSVRNFDLIIVILLTPGLLLIAGWTDRSGYAWLFCIQGLLVIRLILDTIMVRRPLLEPNLSPEGLTFSCFFLVFFLIAALVVYRGAEIKTVNTVRLEQIITARHIHNEVGMHPDTLTISRTGWDNLPPGFRPFLFITERANHAFAPPSSIRKEITGAAVSDTSSTPAASEDVPIIRSPTNPIAVDSPPPAVTEVASLHPELNIWLIMLSLIIAGHLIIVLEFAYIGYRHFGRLQAGIACAALYLFHPYTHQMIGRLDHIIPAALILWSVVAHRRPFFAGLGIGTAAALVYYPLCLVPLWCGFYWHKGRKRFLFGAASAFLAFVALLFFSLPEWGTFSEQLFHLLGKTAFMVVAQPDGFWTSEDMFYRMPVLALFVVVCFGLFFVPSHKHLATLIGGSALLMIGVQFFQLYQGGLYLSWYLPLLILTIFRPNLEDRTARSVVV
jgi:hypothetical protein